ncbi:MAG: hypothetical protein J6B92_00300 [Paraprevotella sp.]|nr:hypothetical protein [Paraprevotella sp.]MBP3472975.1 hypothetical protein [Paraprevotella sp.]
MNSKRFLGLILWMTLSLSALQAQQQKKRFSPEEFKAKLEQCITRKASLTPEEAKAFFPIFHEMRTKQRELMEGIRKLKRQDMPADAKDKDYASVVSEINKKKIESAKLEADYYNKLCKAVPAQKVYKAMKAEDRFHRDMLQRGNNKNRRPGNGRGQGPIHEPAICPRR